MRQVRRGKLAVGIADGSVFADDACVYLAKDMRVRTDRIRGSEMTSERIAHHAPHRGARSESKRHTDQEQIQIIATAIGTPKPSAPKIARTNSESRLAWCRTPRVDMTLLLGAPRASARPQDERSTAPSGQSPWRLSIEAMLGRYG